MPQTMLLKPIFHFQSFEKFVLSFYQSDSKDPQRPGSIGCFNPDIQYIKMFLAMPQTMLLKPIFDFQAFEKFVLFISSDSKDPQRPGSIGCFNPDIQYIKMFLAMPQTMLLKPIFHFQAFEKKLFLLQLPSE